MGGNGAESGMALWPSFWLSLPSLREIHRKGAPPCAPSSGLSVSLLSLIMNAGFRLNRNGNLTFLTFLYNIVNFINVSRGKFSYCVSNSEKSEKNV